VESRGRAEIKGRRTGRAINATAIPRGIGLDVLAAVWTGILHLAIWWNIDFQGNTGKPAA
jgi:hypothetical protein